MFCSFSFICSIVILNNEGKDSRHVPTDHYKDLYLEITLANCSNLPCSGVNKILSHYVIKSLLDVIPKKLFGITKSVLLIHSVLSSSFPFKKSLCSYLEGVSKLYYIV